MSSCLTRRFREADPAAPSVAHVSLDPERLGVPVSSTVLRGKPRSYWRYVPAPVARSSARRIAILGGESSGKSELAAALAAACEAEYAAEYGRELWEARSGKLEFDDMVEIAREQIRREEAAAERGPLVFCDTTPLTTLFYSLDMFGAATAELLELSGRRYDHVILCAPDFAFVQDGTRRDDAFRLRQDAWYRSEFAARRVVNWDARGGLEQRVREIKALLDDACADLRLWPEAGAIDH